jgi:hypothetical protein
MAKYTKKPNVIDAMQWSGAIMDTPKVLEFLSGYSFNASINVLGDRLQVIDPGKFSFEVLPRDWLMINSGNLLACSNEFFNDNYAPVQP